MSRLAEGERRITSQQHAGKREEVVLDEFVPLKPEVTDKTGNLNLGSLDIVSFPIDPNFTITNGPSEKGCGKSRGCPKPPPLSKVGCGGRSQRPCPKK